MDVAVIMSVYKNDSINSFTQAFESLIGQVLEDSHSVNLYICLDGEISTEIAEYLYGKKAYIYYIVQNISNKGLAFSLNLLINNLQNEELVFRMDADDVSRPLRFQKQIDACFKNETAMIVGSNIEKINSAGEVIGYVRYPEASPEIWDMLCFRSPFAHPAVVFRRDFFKKVGIYSTQCGANEDIELWSRAAIEDVKAYNIQEFLVKYRVSDSFYQRRSKDKAIQEFRIYIKYIIKRWGITWRLLFPPLRYLLRVMPKSIIKHIYNMPLITKRK